MPLVRVFEPRLLQSMAGVAAAAGQRWEPAEQHFEDVNWDAQTIIVSLFLSDQDHPLSTM